MMTMSAASGRRIAEVLTEVPDMEMPGIRSKQFRTAGLILTM